MVSGIGEGEASAIAFLLLDKVAGIDKVHALMGDGIRTTDNGPRTTDEGKKMVEEELKEMARRIANGEPAQYVIGEADFYGLTFHVEPGVLIPRPETEELVELIIRTTDNGQRTTDSGLAPVRIGYAELKVLDIGTGSGCIAISLAKNIDNSEVEAWDVSDDAIRIAKANALRNEANVVIKKVDVLSVEDVQGKYDVIVSNPPYICESEASEMEDNVLSHEPHLALFVPNDDPLLFYRKIALLALKILNPNGQLFFEINREYGQETVSLLRQLGYKDVTLHKDQFDNDRMVHAIKP